MAEPAVTFAPESLALPPGAHAEGRRDWLLWGDRPLLALTQGPRRPYLYPLLSPAGYMLASESPADHPHHNALWFGTDHVHVRMPVGHGRHEVYTYGFYTDSVFQGRAPGRQVQTDARLWTDAESRALLVQQIDWRGPGEWGAPEGRQVLKEERRTTLLPGERHHVLRMESSLRAAAWPVDLGPTRHAWFNIRVAETMTEARGGTIRDNLGNIGADRIATDAARWVDITGPVGGGARAGVTVIAPPVASTPQTWFVAGWGVVTVGPFRTATRSLEPGEGFTTRYTVILHDDEIADDEVYAAGRWMEGA
jgi:hypothetical protein